MTPNVDFRVLSEQELNAIRTKMIDYAGDIVKAGLTLKDLRDAIYTKCYRVNPNVEAGKEAEPKPKKAPGKKTPARTLSPDQMDDLLG